jgi:RNA polymerase sigma-32 factor
MNNYLPSVIADPSLASYMRQANSYPLLSQEDEYILAKRVSEYQDVESAQKLITSHLRLVVKMAFDMRGYGVALMDLISEGNIGLMHAVKKFNPELGYRLSTYAMWWIKAAMQEFIIRSKSLVKIGTTLAQKKLFFNLNKIKAKIEHLEGSDLSQHNTKSIAERLQISEREVTDMNRRMTLPDVSLDDPITQDAESTMLETIEDSRESHELTLGDKQDYARRSTLFYQSMGKLNDREKQIISARHLQDSPSTLEELSQKFGVSRERVRQIESRAMEKIKEHCLV